MPKKATQKQKVAVPTKKSKKVPVKAESSSSEEEESEEEVVPVKAKKGAAKVNGKATKKPESSSEEESSEEEAAPVKPAKKGKAAPAKKESSSEEESSEEEEVAPVKPAKKGKAAKPVAAAKKESSDEEEDSDEEESSEEEAAPVKGKAAAAKKEESSEEDDSDESEEEAKPAANKRKANGKAPVAPAKKAKTDSDSDEDDSDDDDDDDDSEEEESEEEAPKKKEPKKRKKEEAAQSPPKKQKLDESADAITLFISGLTADTTEEEVEQFFTKNKVELASVRKPPNKRMAFADLADNDDFDKATALTGSDFQGNTIGVEKAKPRAPKPDFNASGNQSFNSSFGGDDKDSKTLFCKSLPDDVTQASLGELFNTAADIRLPMKDGYPKGFAFIEFEDSATMETAMKEKQGAELGGRNIFLDYMGSKSSFKKNDRGGRGGFGGRGRGSPAGGHSNSGARGESKTLFVKNLSWNTDESSLMSAFEGCVSARIPTFEDSGKPKGFAFVEFGDATQAATAHDTMSGGNLDGRQITIDFAADKRGGGGGRGGGFGGRGGGFGRGRGGDRGGFRGRGRGGDRGRGGRGGFNKERGGIIPGQGKKKTFDDSD